LLVAFSRTLLRLDEALTDRNTVFGLLNEFTKSENLIRHALAVEAAMRAYARKYSENEEIWAAVGLIHDFDYEKYPDLNEHALKGSEILRDKGWPQEMVRAVASHNEETGVSRASRMEKTLYAVDELTGFITAVALVRPSRSLDDLGAKSVKKKMKDRGFAAAVNREQLQASAAELGEDFTEHVDFVIRAMRTIGAELGFARLG